MAESYRNRRGLFCPNCDSNNTNYDVILETWACADCGLDKMDIQEWWWRNGVGKFASQ